MDLDTLIPEASVAFEEALLKNLENESLWLDYYQANESSLERSIFILDRAVSSLPASYTLWNVYLLLPWGEEDGDILLQLYQRALQTLNSEPGIWLRYLQLVKSKKDFSAYGSALDLALNNLHASHHADLWKSYLGVANSKRGSFGANVYKRVFQIQATQRNPFPVDRCECVLKVAQFGDLNSALTLYSQIPRNEIKNAEQDSYFVSIFLDLLISHGSFADHDYLERIALDAALDLPEKKAKFVLKIAMYYEKRLVFNKARHYFNLALLQATNMKALALTFEQYTDFLEHEIISLKSKNLIDEAEMKLRLYENFVEQQKILANDMLLRTEPNNVDLWLDRAEIFRGEKKTNEIIASLVTAIKSVNPLEAHSRKGKSLADIWSCYANLYISLGDNNTARLIYSRAVKSQYKSADELANIYIMWSELALESSDDEALEIVEQVLYTIPSNASEIEVDDISRPIQERVFKSVHLWSFYIDLLTSMSHEDKLTKKLRSAYEAMMSLGVITLRLVFQYADFVLAQKDYAGAYSIYELSISKFNSPTPCFKIWMAYLEKIVSVEKEESKILDVFDRCLASNLPGHLIADVFKMYSQFLQTRGSLAKSIKILSQAVERLSQAYSQKTMSTENAYKVVDDKYEIYLILFDSISLKLKDVDLLRSTITNAVQDTQLSLPMVIELSLKYARFELDLGEIGRARALLKHASSLAHPSSRLMEPVWKEWTEFEARNGTEYTYKDMLSFKRVVANEFEALQDYSSEINPMGFVKADTIQKVEAIQATQDPNAIELDMDM